MKKFFFYGVSLCGILIALVGIAVASTYIHLHPSDSPLPGLLELEAHSIFIDEDIRDEPFNSLSYSQPAEDTSYSSYVLNTSSKKIHKSYCSSISSIKESNKSFTDDYTNAVNDGFTCCKLCFPENEINLEQSQNPSDIP